MLKFRIKVQPLSAVDASFYFQITSPLTLTQIESSDGQLSPQNDVYMLLICWSKYLYKDKVIAGCWMNAIFMCHTDATVRSGQKIPCLWIFHCCYFCDLSHKLILHYIDRKCQHHVSFINTLCINETSSRQGCLLHTDLHSF